MRARCHRAGARPAADRLRAVRLYGIGDLRFEVIPVRRELGPQDVRIRVRAAGVCGSDLHNFRTGQWMRQLPITPGHEFAGEVAEVGAGVTDFKCGDLVLGDSRVSCGRCPSCRAGRPNVCERMGYVGEVCDGAFAEMIDLPAERLLTVPDGVPLQVAALAEPLGVALRVVRRLDPAKDSPIVIAGAGPIGGLAAILLNHLGFGPLGIIERNTDRAGLVASLTGAFILGAGPAGSAGPVASAGADVVRRFAGQSGLRYAIEATGSRAMVNGLLGSLTGGGRLAMVGLFRGEPAFDANAVVERELEIRGCSVFCEEQREVLPLLPLLAAQLSRVISPGIPLERLPGEYGRLILGQSAFLKTIVEPWRPAT